MLINLQHVIPNYGWFLFIGPPCASTLCAFWHNISAMSVAALGKTALEALEAQAVMICCYHEGTDMYL